MYKTWIDVRDLDFSIVGKGLCKKLRIAEILNFNRAVLILPAKPATRLYIRLQVSFRH